MKQPNQVIFIFVIFSSFRKVKNGFARFKQCLANLSKVQVKPFKLVSFSDQPGDNTTQSSLTNIRIIQLNGVQFSKEKEALKAFFCKIQHTKLEDELYRWFYSGLSGNGNHFADLPPEQVEHFKTNLTQLISALYNYHYSKRPAMARNFSLLWCPFFNSVFDRIISYPLQNPIKNLICSPE